MKKELEAAFEYTIKAKEQKAELDKLENEIIKLQQHITKIEESIHSIAVNAPKYKIEYEKLKIKKMKKVLSLIHNTPVIEVFGIHAKCEFL